MKPRKTILFVDDEISLIELFRRILRREGFRHTCHSDPSKALRFFKKNHHTLALAILDVIMPRISGIELSHLFNTIDPDVPVILITANLRPIREEKFASPNIKMVLDKPFTKEDFLSIVSSLVERDAVPLLTSG